MDKSRDNQKLRHRVDELEALTDRQGQLLDEYRKRISDLEMALAERVGYETPFYGDQPRAEVSPR